MIGTHYGKELILDLDRCDPKRFTRACIDRFFKALCGELEMEAHEVFWWDDVGVPPEERQTEPHLKGTSAIQFITTSNITIHTLDLMKTVYLNIFSCRISTPTAKFLSLCAMTIASNCLFNSL